MAKVNHSLIMNNINKWKSLSISLSLTFLKLRYKGTVLGFFWSFLEPLLLLSVFYFIFNDVFGVKIEHFVLHLFVGLLLFYMFVRGTSMGLSSLSSNAHILYNIKLPKIIFPIAYNFTAGIMMLFDFSIFFIYVGVTGFIPPLTIVFLPFFMLLVFLLAVAISLPLSILAVKFKDIGYIWTLITNVIIFLSPIFWKLDALPKNIQDILQYSPWVHLISMAQHAVIDNKVPDVTILFYIIIFISSFLIGGIIIFRKYENKIVGDL
jgi:lipopolysaccharide transport system permease protein